MTQSIETQLALLGQSIGQIALTVSRMEEAQERERVRSTTDNSEMDKRMTALEATLVSVKGQLDGHQPTINDMITIRTKVEGAGHLGKILWATLGATLSFVVLAREAIGKLLTGN